MLWEQRVFAEEVVSDVMAYLHCSNFDDVTTMTLVWAVVKGKM